MKLSAPIYRLKRQAKLLSRKDNIPLHLALNRIALQEGYGDWSLLAAKLSITGPVGRLFTRLKQGDLVLVGGRPGQGKTLLSLEFAVEAMKSDHRAAFFTLEYTPEDVQDRFREIGAEYAKFRDLFTLDCSDAICADYIITVLASARPGTLVVIDYLQLLDQRRETPALAEQVEALKRFAREQGVIIVFISQIDRSYDLLKKPIPDLGDVRLPNPLDVGLFDKTCFLNKGEILFQATV